jgi:hypothetical protein
MKKFLHFSMVLLIPLLIIGCGSDDSGESSSSSNGNSSSGSESTIVNTISGYCVDGPCLAGANVLIKPLDSETLAQTSATYMTTTSTDFGYFEIPTDIDLEVTPYALIKVSEAECHNEVTGLMMQFKTYYALVDLTEGGVQNVSPQTTGVMKRIIELHTNPGSTTYQDFAASKSQAEQEWMLAYGITGITTPFSQMGLESASDGNAALLAMNAIHLYGNTVGEQAELIQNMADDIEYDGVLDDAGSIVELKNNSQALDLNAVVQNLFDRYTVLGYSITPPDPRPLVDSDGDGLLNGVDDDTPDLISFTSVTGEELSSISESNIEIVSGLSPGGTTQINGTIYKNGVLSVNPTVVNGDTLQFKNTNSNKYSVAVSNSFVMDGTTYTYESRTKDDDRQQIIVFDSGQPAQDGDFGPANAQSWCEAEAAANGLTGSVAPLLSTDSSIKDLFVPDSINPRKVQSLWGGLVATRWNNMFINENTETFEDLGIVDTHYWTGTDIGELTYNCDGWTRNGNIQNVIDFGNYNRHDLANRTNAGDPQCVNTITCDQLKKILCVVY